MNRLSKIAVMAAVVATAGVGVAYAHMGGMSRGLMGPGGPMMDRLCGTDVTYHVGKIGDRLAGRLNLTDAEKTSFKDLEDTVTKALTDAKAICTQKPDFATVTGRLDFAAARADAQLTAIKAIQPKLGAFYASLDDSQKKILDGFGAHQWHGHMDRPNGPDGAPPRPDNG
jgi:Spy/CpxP family protein refolding chaperone